MTERMVFPQTPSEKNLIFHSEKERKFKMKRILMSLVLAMALIFSVVGCSQAESASIDISDFFTKRDLAGTWDADEAKEITLADSLTITKAGVYILSGTLENGTITVNAGKDDKVQLVLNGVSITSSNSAAILVENADKVFLTLAEGTENTLTSTAFDENSDVDGTVFARDDIVFNGAGSLTVTSASHGIVGKADVKFASGTYDITTQGRGIDANDSVRIADGSFTIVSEKDAIRAKNEEDAEKGYVFIAGGSFDLTVGGGAANGETHADSMFWGRGWNNTAVSDTTPSAKGVKASGGIIIAEGIFAIDAADDALHSDTDATIYGGTFTINTGDDAFHADSALTIHGGDIEIKQSYEGLEASAITLNGGNIALVSSDDGLNAAGGNDSSGWGRNDMFSSDGSSIVINGGNLYVNAQGDGIDSNGDLTVNGGTIVVSGPTSSGNGALDGNGTIAINGGTVIAAGAAGMVETFGASSTQVSFLTNLNGAAGSEIKVTDQNGNVLLSGTVEKNLQCVVVSSPDLQVGETYTVSAGSASATVTVSAVSSSGSGMGGWGGFGGGMGGYGNGGGGRGGRSNQQQPNAQQPMETPDPQSVPDDMPSPPDGSDFQPGQTPPDGSIQPGQGGGFPGGMGGFPGGPGNQGGFGGGRR